MYSVWVCVFVTDHSNGYEHPGSTGAAGVPTEPVPDRIRPQPRQPEGL